MRTRFAQSIGRLARIFPTACHSRSPAARSVWSAWSLLPLSNAEPQTTAPASWTHSIRFARSKAPAKSARPASKLGYCIADRWICKPSWSGTRAFCSAVLLCLTLAPFAAFGTDDFYFNFGTVTEPPQVDAVNFVNYGTFNIFTTDPFETSNTRNFTNYG